MKWEDYSEIVVLKSQDCASPDPLIFKYTDNHALVGKSLVWLYSIKPYQ